MTKSSLALLALLCALLTTSDAFARSRCASGLCNKQKKRSSGKRATQKAFSQRGMTAGKNKLNVLASPVERTGDIDIGSGLLHVGGLNFTNDGDPRLGLGVAYGITDTIEVGGYLLNLNKDGGGDVGLRAPFLWSAIRLETASSEYGIRVGLAAPVQETEDFRLHLATPVYVPIGESSAFEFALSLDALFLEEETGWLFSVPIRILTNITPEVFIGFKTAFFLPDFEGSLLVIPLGFVAGYTVIIDKRPLADIGIGFNFPFFVAPSFDDDEGEKQIVTELYELGLGANLSFKF